MKRSLRFLSSLIAAISFLAAQTISAQPTGAQSPRPQANQPTPQMRPQGQDPATLAFKEKYTKREVMIPMRDGVKLYTAIYEPKDNSTPHPIIISRTPYGNSPYGEEQFSYSVVRNTAYTDLGYILVYQDVRGRYQSEGEFVQVRPLNKNAEHNPGKKLNKKLLKEIDETTDCYDTVEWLIRNTHSNGNVGAWGVSYDGFHVTQMAKSNHPAVKAVIPQAPVTDWFRGDDRHHNGAFTLLQTTNFLPSLEGRNIGRGVIRDIVKADVYTDLLKAGTFRDIDKLVADEGETMWNNIKKHPDFDEFWKERDARSICYDIKPAVMVVGGLFDSEDNFGAWNLYQAIRKQSPATDLYMIFGPWTHGGWSTRVNSLDHVWFGEGTGAHLAELQLQFFRHYLEGVGEKPKDHVHMFYTGENQWHYSDAWPIAECKPTPFYVHADGSVSTSAPVEKESYSEYVSDLAHPVPYSAAPTPRRTTTFMIEDQRFAATRPDVLTFMTEPLTEDLTLAGPVEVQIKTAISSTDADFMVKVIDVFPDGFSYPMEVRRAMNNDSYLMSGFQMLVRGEIFRGRYRNGFDNPQPFVPGEITDVNYTLYDLAHTFQKGHRLMIQIQSSWFPIVDRNPQKFINTYDCGVEDFVMQENIRIYHQQNAASRVLLPVVK